MRNLDMEKMVLSRNGNINKDIIQRGMKSLKKTTNKKIKITSILLNSFDLVNRFAYLIIERRKLMYKIIFEHITFANITTITYLSAVINSKLTNIHLTLKRQKVKPFNNKKRKLSQVEQEITPKKVFNQNDSNNNYNKNDNLTLTKINNDNNENKRKRGGSPIFLNDPKRLKPAEEQSSSQNQLQDEIVDETYTKWSHSQGNSLTQYLEVMKQEWGVQNLSNKHSNLTRMVGLNGKDSKGPLKKCTLIFESKIKDLQQIERKLIREVYSLRKQLSKCRYSSQEYVSLQRKMRGLKQKMNEIDNRLTALNQAEKEVKKINQIYKEDCPSYQEYTEECVDLDFIKRFYTP